METMIQRFMDYTPQKRIMSIRMGPATPALSLDTKNRLRA